MLYATILCTEVAVEDLGWAGTDPILVRVRRRKRAVRRNPDCKASRISNLRGMADGVSVRV